MVWLKVPSDPDRIQAGRIGADTLGIGFDVEFRPVSVGVIAAQSPISKIAGRKITVGNKIDWDVQIRDQRRRERTDIARAIGRRGGEALAAIRQRRSHKRPPPAAIRGGRAQLC